MLLDNIYTLDIQEHYITCHLYHLSPIHLSPIQRFDDSTIAPFDLSISRLLDKTTIRLVDSTCQPCTFIQRVNAHRTSSAGMSTSSHQPNVTSYRDVNLPNSRYHVFSRNKPTTYIKPLALEKSQTKKKTD